MSLARLLRLRSRIPRGAVILSVISVVNVVLGFAREGVVAFYFGTSADLDAFLVANTVPRVIVGQAVQITVAIILPLYVEHLENGRRDQATALLRRWFVLLLQVTTGLCLLLAAVAPWLVAAIGNGLTTEQIDRATRWMWWLLGYVWLVAMTGCFKVVLDQNRRFFLPALWTGFVSVSVIGSCWLWSDSMGVAAMIPGFVIGGGLAFVFQWWQSWRFEPRLVGLRKLPLYARLPIIGGGIMIINAFAQQANLIIDRGFASQLPDGSIAALNYANALVLVPQTILPAALATALFPQLAEMVARGNWRGAFRTTVRWTLVVGAISLAAVAVMCLLRHELVALLFQRGEFGADATTMTATALLVLPFNVVVTGASVLVSRLLLAQQQLRVILLTTALGVLVKIAANVALVSRYGLAGIAAATVIGGAVATLVRFWYAARYRPVVAA